MEDDGASVRKRGEEGGRRREKSEEEGDCHRAGRVNTVIEETMRFLVVNPFGG